VLLRLEPEGDAVALTVSDDGAGFDVSAARAQGRGLGLFGMEERAFYVGGSVRIRSERGRGTEVVARVPLERAPS
jgi:signal transduction histidine kinase